LCNQVPHAFCWCKAPQEEHAWITSTNVVLWRENGHLSSPDAKVRFRASPKRPPTYGYWTNEKNVATLQEFVAGATEHKGSWWPDWIQWIGALAGKKVPAKGARLPGKGKLKAIEAAPGS